MVGQGCHDTDARDRATLGLVAGMASASGFGPGEGSGHLSMQGAGGSTCPRGASGVSLAPTCEGLLAAPQSSAQAQRDDAGELTPQPALSGPVRRRPPSTPSLM